MRKKLSVLFIVAVIAATMCIALTGCGSADSNSGKSQKVNPNKINLNDYLVVEEAGMNGYGYIDDIYIDSEKLIEDYSERFNNLSYVVEEVDGWGIMHLFFAYGEDGGEILAQCQTANFEEALRMLVRDESPRWHISDDDEQQNEEHTLKNGDKIELFVGNTSSKYLDEILGLKIECSDFKYKMNTLQEIKEVDPFEKVELSLYGKNGEGAVNDSAKAYIPTIKGTMATRVKVDMPENNGSLSNGDKVHVYLDGEVDADTLIQDYGVIFTRTEADIEIHGLNAYGQPGASNGEKATVNLNDYVKCSNWGNYETDGALQVQIQYEEILIDNLRSVSENVAPEDMLNASMVKSAIKRLFEGNAPFEIISTSHGYNAHGSFTDVYGEGFSNGDVVELSWQVNEEALQKLRKLFNVEFVFEDFSHTIEGLKPIIEFDPFEEYEIFCTGGDGSATFSCVIYFYPYRLHPDEVTEWEIDVIAENNGSLSNGDIIVLSVKADAESGNFLNNWGLVPTRTEIEVVVSGLE